MDAALMVTVSVCAATEGGGASLGPKFCVSGRVDAGAAGGSAVMAIIRTSLLLLSAILKKH
jgi:hypothetical protein